MKGWINNNQSFVSALPQYDSVCWLNTEESRWVTMQFWILIPYQIPADIVYYGNFMLRGILNYPKILHRENFSFSFTERWDGSLAKAAGENIITHIYLFNRQENKQWRSANHSSAQLKTSTVTLSRKRNSRCTIQTFLGGGLQSFHIPDRQLF